MALIRTGVSKCPLCGETLQPGDALVATSGAFLPPTDPAWPMCDAGLHSSCYERWPERRRFARAYFTAKRQPGNPFWGTVIDDDDLRVTVNPGPDVDQVHVDFAETLSGARVSLHEWSQWVSSEPDPDARPIWREALASALPRLRALGSAEELVARAVFAPMDPELLRESFCYQARGAAYQISQRGAPCPTCGSERKDHRVVDELNTGGHSHFICSACGATFTHHDLLPPRPWARGAVRS